MEELYDLLDKLKESIDSIDCVKNVKIVQLRMSKDKNLMSKLREYHLYNNPKIRNEIASNSDVRLYRHLENQVNYIILSVNKSLNSIIPNDSKEKLCE